MQLMGFRGIEFMFTKSEFKNNVSQNWYNIVRFQSL